MYYKTQIEIADAVIEVIEKHWNNIVEDAELEERLIELIWEE